METSCTSPEARLLLLQAPWKPTGRLQTHGRRVKQPFSAFCRRLLTGLPCAGLSIPTARYAGASVAIDSVRLSVVGGTSSVGSSILEIFAAAKPCDASSAPANGLVGTCTSSLSAGSTCQPVCNANYGVSGTTTCTVNGQLVAATCTQCDASAAPANGLVGTCTSTLAAGSTCQPSCNSGYSVSGLSTCSAAGALTLATCARYWVTRNAMPMTVMRGDQNVGTDGQCLYVAANAPSAVPAGVLDCLKYTVATDTWTSIRALPTAVKNVGSAVVGSSWYIVSAFPSTLVGTLKYSVDSDSWTTKRRVPTTRTLTGIDSEGSFVATAVIGTQMYVAGCRYCPGRPSSVQERYETGTDTWSTVRNMPTGRFAMGFTASGNQIFAATGYSNPAFTSTNDLEIYSAVSDSWTSGRPAPTSRLYSQAAVAWTDQLFLVGYVIPNSRSSTIERYQISSDTWTTSISMPSTRYDGALTAVENERLFYMGGPETAPGLAAALETFSVPTPDLTPSPTPSPSVSPTPSPSPSPTASPSPTYGHGCACTR